MTDSDSERVGGVVRRGRRGEAENQLHHLLHLVLLGTAVPDDGALDVSTTRYYRMEALNDNGSSPPSQPPWAAVPQNRTRPSPPTALQGTGGQQNAIPLQWVSPMTNQSPLNVLSCSGAGGNSSGANIPVTGEIIKYRVYRGTTQTFDPATQGVKVLEFDGASQPSVAGPGATINWIGSGTNSAYPPANCVDYYYRVQAADRCYKQANWNASDDARHEYHRARIGRSRGWQRRWHPQCGNCSLHRIETKAVAHRLKRFMRGHQRFDLGSVQNQRLGHSRSLKTGVHVYAQPPRCLR